jgi:hypothetical protein
MQNFSNFHGYHIHKSFVQTFMKNSFKLVVSMDMDLVLYVLYEPSPPGNDKDDGNDNEEVALRVLHH